MQALTTARQRLRARLESPSTPRAVRLAHLLVADGRARFLPVLSSPLAQDILSRGYDPYTLDRIYGGHKASRLGPLGQMADHLVQNLPLHRGLRERLEAAAGELCAALVSQGRAGAEELRVLHAPCGLGAEVLAAAEQLRQRHPELLSRLRYWGLDPREEVLAETALRCAGARFEAHLAPTDLGQQWDPQAIARREGPFHVICCLGLGQHLSAQATARALHGFGKLLVPGGRLLVDRWEPTDKASLSAGLGFQLRYDSGPQFHALLREAGFCIAREHPTGEGGCTLVVANRR